MSKLSNSVLECDDCGWKGYPGFELAGSKLFAQCGNGECGHMDRRYTIADFNTGVARIDGQDVAVAPDGTKATPLVTMPAAPIVVQPMAHIAQYHPGLPLEPKPAGKSLPVLRMARARVRELSALLKQAKAWQAERDELSRLLDAAKRRRSGAVAEPTKITAITSRTPKSISR